MKINYLEIIITIILLLLFSLFISHNIIDWIDNDEECKSKGYEGYQKGLFVENKCFNKLESYEITQSRGLAK